MIATRSAGPHYRVEAADPAAHLFHVTLTVTQPQAGQRVSLPAWIPGSYLVREFAKNLQKLTARQDGRAVTIHQVDKATWQVDCMPSSPLVLAYEVYAFDNSVRTAWLDSQRGFFNGTSLCLRVHGQAQEPHELELVPPRAYPHWEAATGLEPLKTGKRGFGTYLAADYDELVDCPVELGAFHSAEFRACGVPHRLVVAGAPASFDAERLLADTQRICEHQIRFWHDRKRPPFKSYLFLLNVVDDGYGGLEHRNSTALICSRRDLPRLGEARLSDGYVTLLGLVSHEYFHTWNVKRLRPQQFARYDYTRENYTELLWFFEGFTSYYDDLFLARAGLIEEGRYLKLLSKTISGVLATPGREVQSVAQASFDAWVKYYRQDENTVNATVSYYTKGSLVALAIDLTLRSEQRGSLDDVMRTLWQRSGGGPISEDDIAAALKEVSGRSFARELARWVHGTQDLPLENLLRDMGVQWKVQAPPWPLRLGMRTADSAGAVQVKAVMRGQWAEGVGLAAGDELLAVNDWRLRKLDDIALYAREGETVELLVSRDQRLWRLAGSLPAPQVARANVSLVVAVKAPEEEGRRRQQWIGRV